MKGGCDPRLLAKVDTIRTDGEPSKCELVRRACELCAASCGRGRSTRRLHSQRCGRKASLTIGGLVKETAMVAVEEGALAGRAAGPRQVAWMVRHFDDSRNVSLARRLQDSVCDCG